MMSYFEQRCRWSERPSSAQPGVYAYFVASPDDLLPIEVPSSGLLYVGMTDAGLDARCHFDHPHSGFSTFRRSLGAILAERLRLTAIPRAPGPSATNTRNYRFKSDGEARLTAWMRRHLTYAHSAVDGDLAALEAELIGSLEPPLNLTGWPNPQRPRIKRLRAKCAEDARLSR